MLIPEKCPKCGSGSCCKNGFNGYAHKDHSNRKQRYLCLDCRYTFTEPRMSTEEIKNWGYSARLRRGVVALYKTGKYSYRAVGKRYKVNEKTVRNWVLQAAQSSAEIPKISDAGNTV